MQGEVFVVFWNVKRLGEGTDRETKGVTEYTLHFPVYDALVTRPAQTTGCTDCGSLRREVTQGVRDHAVREECSLRALRRRLFQSGAAVRILHLSPPVIPTGQAGRPVRLEAHSLTQTPWGLRYVSTIEVEGWVIYAHADVSRVFAPQEGALLVNRGSWAWSTSSLSSGAVTRQPRRRQE
ncbi:hypothetical protein EDB85DRAFT_1901264 [Lactarius pseudohatsudake]|nr:hypothetical protein EDB85DRAFT_1901264 [Lactarius pseudohatsudake]